MATETKYEMKTFDIRTPYLTQGRTTKIVAETESLDVTVKVYAQGGENAMHHHPVEEHAFIVLEGEATFHLETDDNIAVVGPYEGVVIPRGCNYWFLSSGDRNLVMIRVGSWVGPKSHDRIAPDGHPIPGDSEENKSVPRIEAPGPGFGAKS